MNLLFFDLDQFRFSLDEAWHEKIISFLDNKFASIKIKNRDQSVCVTQFIELYKLLAQLILAGKWTGLLSKMNL